MEGPFCSCCCQENNCSSNCSSKTMQTYSIRSFFTTILGYTGLPFENIFCKLRQIARAKSDGDNMPRKIQTKIHDISGNAKSSLIIPQLLMKVSAVIDFNPLKSSHSFLVVLARQNAPISPLGTLGALFLLGLNHPRWGKIKSHELIRST